MTSNWKAEMDATLERIYFILAETERMRGEKKPRERHLRLVPPLETGRPDEEPK